MRAFVKMVSLIVGLSAAAVLVYRTTHVPPPSPAEIRETLEKCDKNSTDPACPRTDFTFAPSK